MTKIKTGTAAIAVLALAALGGCGPSEAENAAPTTASTPPSATPAPAASTTPTSITITGAFALTGASSLEIPRDDSECMGHTGYASTAAGDQATITDAAGAVVGIAELLPSIVLETGGCAWYFKTDVPAGGGFYTAKYKTWASQVFPEAGISDEVLIIAPEL